MKGLVLEGGGARGAYQAGALKALVENGYEFNGIVGTSIGAINAAVIAQDEFDKLYSMWEDVNYSTLMDVDDIKIAKLFSRNIDVKIIKYITSKIKGTIKNKGIDTSKIRGLLSEVIDEEKIRQTGKDYGLVTFNLSDKKPLELYIEDIPKGKLIDYLLASSRLPIFKAEIFEEKVYLDGGVYNNCPINMLDKKGYTDVVVIRTNNEERIKNKSKLKNIKSFIVIRPYDELPGIMTFDNKSVKKMIKLGYYDALKTIKKLDGFRSYLIPYDEEKIFNSLCNIDPDIIYEIAVNMGIKEYMSPKKVLFEKIIPNIALKIGYKGVGTYKEVIYALLEYIAIKEKIDLLEIMTLDELLSKIKEKIKVDDKKKIKKSIYILANSLNLSNKNKKVKAKNKK